MTGRSLLGTMACCLACFLAMVGCQPSTEQLAPVQGRVTYRGQPLRFGTVVFIPDASRGTHGSLAIADIQPDGTFTLKTNGAWGAVSGHHKVTISCVNPAGPNAVPQSPLPAKYRDPNQSGLAREVQVNKSNVFDFDLE